MRQHSIHDVPPSDVESWTNVVDEETGRMHVMPMFGSRRHVFYPQCWCHPVSPADEHQVVVHNVAH